MELFSCRSVIEVRNGLTFLDLIVQQIEVNVLLSLTVFFEFSRSVGSIIFIHGYVHNHG